jgi:rare lipoprotein A
MSCILVNVFDKHSDKLWFIALPADTYNMKRYIFVFFILTGIVFFSAAQTANDGSFRQEGIASWYGKEFEGRPTANGEIFNPSLFTAAHPSLPFGTILTITNKQNMKQVTVRVNDRGPFVSSRIIDLSMAAAEALDIINTGTAPVIVEKALNTVLGPVLGQASDNKSVPVTAAVTANTNSSVSAETDEPIKQKPPVTTGSTTQLEIVNVPADSPLVEEYINTSTPKAQEFYNAPAAKIVGTIPPTTSSKLYRLQVGAFTVPKNALNAFDKLKSAGLNPAYEQNGEFYRVVLAGLKASEIQAVAQILANNGFQEAIIREETN